MDHQKAIESEAVKRYLAGTMLDGETADFEEHAAECTACGASIGIGGIAESRSGLDIILGLLSKTAN